MPVYMNANMLAANPGVGAQLMPADMAAQMAAEQEALMAQPIGPPGQRGAFRGAIRDAGQAAGMDPQMVNQFLRSTLGAGQGSYMKNLQRGLPTINAPENLPQVLPQIAGPSMLGGLSSSFDNVVNEGGARPDWTSVNWGNVMPAYEAMLNQTQAGQATPQQGQQAWNYAQQWANLPTGNWFNANMQSPQQWEDNWNAAGGQQWW